MKSLLQQNLLQNNIYYNHLLLMINLSLTKLTSSLL